MCMLRPFLLLMLLSVLPGAAWAASSCTINATTGANFGNYDPIGAHATAPLNATGTVSIQCNGAADDLTVSFDQGSAPAPGSSCSLPLRQMRMGTSRLRYDLYRDPARSLVWGCTSATSEHRILPNGASFSNFTIYARIPAAQNPAVGSYIDTIGMNVTF